MKADANGTTAERARAHMGWKSPAQVKAAGSDRACAICHYYWVKETPSRDGAACGNYLPYCGHPHCAGNDGDATRQGACCDRWEMKL